MVNSVVFKTDKVALNNFVECRKMNLFVTVGVRFSVINVFMD